MTTLKENATFGIVGPSWSNACVGDNGSPNLIDYASGFASAANALLDAAIAGRGRILPVDTLIYPICFNMRHAVELFLKSASADLDRLALVQGRPRADSGLANSHDLSRIWTVVREQAAGADQRLTAITSQVDEYVTDIAQVDATGQVFRYPFDLENKKHLTEFAIINVLVVKRRFKRIEELLHDLRRMIERLSDEYSWGTFTRKLSRDQLFEIARALPPRSAWQSPDFAQAKAALKTKYGLSSNELCKALNLIQQRHELAALVGLKVELPGLSQRALKEFFDAWSTAHDLDAIKNPRAGELVEAEAMDVDRVLQWDEALRAAGAAIVKSVDPGALATLRALYYFRREPPFSEAFERTLRIQQSEAKLHEQDAKEFRRAARKLLSKPRAMEYVLYSLNFLGQLDELEFVIKQYDLASARGRLLSASI